MKRSRYKITFLILGAIFGLVLVFLPQILSTPLGKPIFEKALSSRFHATVHIGTSSLTWMGPQSFQQITFSNPGVSGSIEMLQSDVPLWRLSHFGDAFLLKNGHFAFSALEQVQISQVQAEIRNQEVQAEGISSQGGQFTVRGKVYSQRDFDLIVNLQNMPSIALDQLLNAKGMLSAALGNIVNLSADIVYQNAKGRLVTSLSSPNSSASVEGQIEGGALLLSKPLAVDLTLSPELAKALRKRTSLPVIQANQPITLRIDPQGTSIPLSPFSMSQLEIGNGVLDLGQVVLDKIPQLSALFALMRRSSAPPHTLVWFSPLFFSVEQGVLSMGRVDALVSGLHVCSWGTVNLVGSTLDLVFGIPADTLESALGVTNLSRNYILKIPVQGSITDPNFDTGPATAKITMLLAGQQFSSKLGPFGRIIDPFTKLNSDQDNPPPNRPFPWEK